MSVKSWLAEFYPTPANDPSLDTDVKRLKHGILKWKGYKPENLKRHDVMSDPDDDFPCEIIPDSENCALCQAHPHCGGCPLVAVRGVPCDEPKYTGAESPYGIMDVYLNPEPMLKLLRMALALCRKQERERAESKPSRKTRRPQRKTRSPGACRSR